MRPGSLMASVATLALAASAAHAQTNTDTTIVGSNKSTVTVTGTGNASAVNNGQDGNENNISLVVQNGWYNSATVQQVGDVNDSAIDQQGSYNVASHEQTGTDNIVRTAQEHDNHVSEVAQDGDRNVAYVTQVDGWANKSNSRQTGQDNLLSARSSGNGSTNDIRQLGSNNRAVAVQADGDRNKSVVDQQADASAGAGTGLIVEVKQHGSDNSSTITQSGANNSATATLGTAEANGPRLLSHGSSNRINQTAADNVAVVAIYEGSVEARNSSHIDQGGTATGSTRNSADVAIRGFGNSTGVTQWGYDHSARVSILGGGIGTDAEGRALGNAGTVFQEGSLKGHSARMSVGGSQPLGYWTENRIRQTGNHATISNDAILWQTGRFNTVDISQTIRGAQDDGGSTADVAQGSSDNSLRIAQVGHHRARVTQGVGDGNDLSISQVDSGGRTRFDFVEMRYYYPDTIYRGNNQVAAGQYGDRNFMSIAQEGSDLSATLWQKAGSSDNSISINQGGSTPGTGWFARNSTAAVTQEGSYNVARIAQFERDNVATIDQRGTGTKVPGEPELPNYADIQQLGAELDATIVQTQSVGASSVGDPESGIEGDPGYFGGGARSSNAYIGQEGLGSSAMIEQRGRGQSAIIVQSGDNQTASILQDMGATNATARIDQSGYGNVYSIIQTQPGQYIHVSQTGTNNSVNAVVERGGS